MRIFKFIVRDHVVRYMKKLNCQRSANVAKYVHNWQNTGDQKSLFYGEEAKSLYPAGCGEHEYNLHSMGCSSPVISKYHIKRRDTFKEFHKNWELLRLYLIS